MMVASIVPQIWETMLELSLLSAERSVEIVPL